MARVTLASGLSLSYTRRGDESAPAVLLLPGPTDSWRSYEPVLDLLPDEICAIAVSQRGHGDSDKPETGYAVEDFAGDAVALLDALGIERAILAGHSGSCLVARRVALDHPGRVAGLILEASPTTLRGHAELIDFVESAVAELEDPISPALVRSFVTGTSSENIPPDLLEVLVAEALKAPARVWKQTFSGLLSYDDTSDLGRVEAPTLLVWGDGDDLVSREMQDTLVQSLRDARLLVYRGARHSPRWEDPRRFSSDLVTFAARSA